MTTAAYVVAGCQAAIAVTFARAAFGKITGRDAFADFHRWLLVAVRVPRRAAAPVAVTVLTAEAATAVAVLVPAARTAGLAVATLLLIVFTAAVARMWRRRVGVPCRCFGAGRHPPGPVHVSRNAALLLIAATGLALSAAAGLGLSATGPGFSTATGLGLFSADAAAWDPAIGLAAIAGAAVAVLLTDLEEIVAVARPGRRTEQTGATS